MATLTHALQMAKEYAKNQSFEVRVSGLYDCFPSAKRMSTVPTDSEWPRNFPQHSEKGLYLFLAEDSPEPCVIWVGEVHGETRDFDCRLCDYFDMDAYSATSVCVLRDEWKKGKKVPWCVTPRFIVTISVGAGSEEIVAMEKYLIETLDPCQNSTHRKSPTFCGEDKRRCRNG